MSKYIEVKDCKRCREIHFVDSNLPCASYTDIGYECISEECRLPNMPKTIDDAIDELEKLLSHYPTNVFTEIPDGFLDDLAVFCEKSGIRIDCLSADYARHFLGLAIERLREAKNG